MSYILDALRRADSERDRGAVPNIHSKPVSALTEGDEEEVERGRSPPLRWAVIGLSVLLIAVLAWHYLGSGAPQNNPAPAPAPAPALEPLPVATPAPLPTAVVAVAPPQPEPPEPRAAAPVRSSPRTAQDKAIPGQAKSKTSEANDDEPPVVGVNQLPENIRRELPQLSVGGAMYSKNAASRMLILNGQVFHEGDKISPELVLEQIRLKSAVLSYKGHRYGIDY